MNPNANSQAATFAKPAEHAVNRYEPSYSRIQELQTLSEFRKFGMRTGNINLLDPSGDDNLADVGLNGECTSVEERVRHLFIRCLYTTRTDFLDFGL